MTDMPFRRVRLQQQFVPYTSTSKYDCSAAAGAMVADADSRGEFVFNHSQVRLRTNEPVPAPSSPGLTIEQVRNSLLRLTAGAVDITVYPLGSDFDTLVEQCMAGAWAIVALWRGVIVDAGYGGTALFRGGHGSVYTYDQNEERWILGDPLTPKWLYVPPEIVSKACSEFLRRVGVGAGVGNAYFGLTQDVYEPAEEPEGGDAMYNVAPSATYRDAVLRAGTILYKDSKLTQRHSVIDSQRNLGYAGSGNGFKVVVNSGYTNFVRPSDVLRTVNFTREYE